jgi:lipopolysaccharide transport system ATP-binding protein
MGNLALRVEQLSKLYRLGGFDPYRDLRRSARHSLRSAKRALLRQPPPPPLLLEGGQLLWALRDLSFEVRHGEAIGVIGRNGAGKSTLLKILARITKPTLGYADVYGRLGALLEVGTGFHPELTGRENIFLNATILGLKRDEIARRFDEIVDFAELEQFIDTPVKHYSSGMFARLAFSVAAHLDPDILLVDEVLSVGDASFQRKSLGKMEGVMKQGRTVLFVSHSLSSVVSFCSRVIWLEQGRVVADGPSAEVTKAYLDASAVVGQATPITAMAGAAAVPVAPGANGGHEPAGPELSPLWAPIDLSQFDSGSFSDLTYYPRAESEGTSEQTREAMRLGQRYGSGKARFTSLQMVPLAANGRPQPVFRTGDDLQIDLTIDAFQKVRDANVATVIYNLAGVRIIDVCTALNDEYLSLEPGEKAKLRFVLRNVLLKPDTYRLLLWMGRRDIEDIDGIPLARALTVEVNPETTRHFQVFPGVYQCQFTHHLEVG